MGHNIDLSKYKVRTDLAIELTEGKETTRGNIKVTDIVLTKEEGEKIGKKEGRYITIEFNDITDYDNGGSVKKMFIKQLSKLLKVDNIKDDNTCLIVGLGNKNSTPDSIGPYTLDNVLVTNHLYLYGNLDSGYRRTYAISPGVMGNSGIETSDMIKGICDKIKPDFVLVIDALASSSIERVNRTIQMTDSGINPGSGIGNKRKEISKDSLGIPVFAIGVPTVVDAASIVSDTINYMYKHYAYTKANYDNPAERLKVKVNYLNKNINIEDKDKKSLFGLVGNLSEEEVRKLIYEVLNPVGYNLMVTPKEEDFIVSKFGQIIGEGINQVLHKSIK